VTQLTRSFHIAYQLHVLSGEYAHEQEALTKQLGENNLNLSFNQRRNE